MTEKKPQAPAGRTFLLIVHCVVAVLLMSQAYPPAAEALPRSGGEKRVLVLYSQPRDFPVTEMVEKGIREVLEADRRFPIQLFSEYLDLSRFRDVSQRNALADLLQQRYSGGQNDLIICVDVLAAHFLMEHEENLFPNIPVVMCSIPEILKERILTSPLKGRVSGVIEPAFLARRLVETAFLFKPATKHAVLIAGAFENDEARAVALRETLEALQPTVELIDLTGLSLGDVLERCGKLPQDAIIFFSTLFVDSKGRSFIPQNVLQSIASVTNTPIFGPYESYMGSGIIGGPLISPRLEGKKAAEIALRILGGQSPIDFPFLGADTYVTLYDWRQLKLHNIAENLLPEESTILFREATIWDLYKFYIIGVAALLALQSMLIVGLVFNLRQRKKAEAALRDSQQGL